MRFLSFILFLFWSSLCLAQTLEEQFAQLTTEIQEAATNEERRALLIKSENLIYANIPKIADAIGAAEEVQEFIFDPELSYKEVFKKWKKDFEDKDLRKLLEEVADGSKLKNKSIEALKKSRKFANALRSAHSLLGNGDKLPKIFNKYVKGFGKMNDLIAIKHDGAIEEARNLLKLMDEENLVKKMKSIEGTTTLRFRETVKTISDEISELASREVLDIHQYHAIRKDFKSYIFIFKNLSEVNGSEDAFVKLYTSLDELNDTFGQLNDFYTGLENAEIMKLKHHAVQFNNDAKKALMGILDKSNQVACKIQFKQLTPD